MRYLRLSMLETDSICAKSCAEMEIGMDKENAIEVKNITKDFKVYYDKGSELKEKMLFWKRNRYEKRHVLNGISFNVKRGEAIGLVGQLMSGLGGCDLRHQR